MYGTKTILKSIRLTAITSPFLFAPFDTTLASRNDDQAILNAVKTALHARAQDVPT